MSSEYSNPVPVRVTIGQASPAEIEATNTSWQINVDKWKPQVIGAWFKFGKEFEDVPYLYFQQRRELTELVMALLEFDINWQAKERELADQLEEEKKF